MDPSQYDAYEQKPQTPTVVAFFEKEKTAFTITYVVADKTTNTCVIIDPSLNFDLHKGAASTDSIEKVIEFVKAKNLKTEYVLDTHIHADHVTGASWVRKQLNVPYLIGKNITKVQEHFHKYFNMQGIDAAAFDRLLDENDTFAVGSVPARVLHTPGHTPACLTYVIGDAVFVGDTLFMPDMGSARTDFPGGSAEVLWNSIQQILSLPDEYRIFVGHDYAPNGRPYKWETTVAEEKASNIHVGGTNTMDSFVNMRTTRDKTLPLPNMFFPSIQLNINGGKSPQPETNGASYVKIPIKNVL